MPAAVQNSSTNASFVSAGGHSIVVDAGGMLWTWGRNDSAGGGGYGSPAISDAGQLGAARQNAAEAAAAPLHSTLSFVAADAGRYHSAAVTTDGQLVTWGLNDFGELSLWCLQHAMPFFRLQCRCIGFSTEQQSGISDHACLFAGQLGRDGMDEHGSICSDGASCRDGHLIAALPIQPLASGDAFVAVAAGRYHTVAATKKGAVYTTGLNLCGQPKVCPAALH